MIYTIRRRDREFRDTYCRYCSRRLLDTSRYYDTDENTVVCFYDNRAIERKIKDLINQVKDLMKERRDTEDDNIRSKIDSIVDRLREEIKTLKIERLNRPYLCDMEWIKIKDQIDRRGYL